MKQSFEFVVRSSQLLAIGLITQCTSLQKVDLREAALGQWHIMLFPGGILPHLWASSSSVLPKSVTTTRHLLQPSFELLACDSLNSTPVNPAACLQVQLMQLQVAASTAFCWLLWYIHSPWCNSACGTAACHA